MADLRSSNDDDAVPHSQQHQQDRPISLPVDEPRSSQQDAEATGPENSSDGKQSAEAQGHDIEASEQGPGPSTAPPATVSGAEEQAKPAVDPTVTKHVNDVMASEVTTVHPMRLPLGVPC